MHFGASPEYSKCKIIFPLTDDGKGGEDIAKPYQVITKILVLALQGSRGLCGSESYVTEDFDEGFARIHLRGLPADDLKALLYGSSR